MKKDEKTGNVSDKKKKHHVFKHKKKKRAEEDSAIQYLQSQYSTVYDV